MLLTGGLSLLLSTSFWIDGGRTVSVAAPSEVVIALDDVR